MIRNAKKLQLFERELVKKERPDYLANLRLVEAMHVEAVALGALPLKDPLAGIATDIQLAKALNGV